MIIFFDTEFTGLYRNTQLISIGMVAQNGQKFYGEFTDYQIDHRLDKWVKDNVIKHTTEFDENFKSQVVSDGYCVFIKNGRYYMKHALSDWLEHFGEPIQLVSDVCHYDMFLFCDLFGGAFNIPKCVNPACYDICQDIAHYAKPVNKKWLDEDNIEPSTLSIDLPYPVDYTVRVTPNMGVEYNYLTTNNNKSKDLIDMKMDFAFGISRELLCKGLTGTLPKGHKHNSLYDAEVIKMIYEALNKGE